MSKFTTKDLSRKLLQALNSSSVAHGNMVARVGAVMIASKQLELNEKAHGNQQGVTLVDADEQPARLINRPATAIEAESNKEWAR